MKNLVKERLKIDFEKNLDLDIAIIGGGISGLYSAWRLAKSGAQSRKVHVFEMSKRIGGRLESTVLPGMTITAELGGMRYMTSQQLVTSLIESVFASKLEAVDFPMGDPSMHLFFMRNQRFRADEWERSQKEGKRFETHYFLEPDCVGFSPDQLFNKIVFDVLNADPWFGSNFPGKISNPSPFDYQFQLTAIDWDVIKPKLTYCFPGPYEELRVNELGFWNVIKDRVGEEAYEFLSVAGGYYSNTINWNAAEAFPYMVGDFSNVETRYKTIKGGYDQIAYAIASDYLDQQGGQIWCQNRLVTFAKAPKGSKRRYQLTFLNGPANAEWVVEADSIVLAMPRRSLELLNQLNFFFTFERHPDFARQLGSVIMEPSFKLLMGFENPWWQSDFKNRAGASVTDLPMRQCYYFGTDTEDSHSLFLASYNDMETVTFWSVLENRHLGNWVPFVELERNRLTSRTLEPLKFTGSPLWQPRKTLLASSDEIADFENVQAPAVMVREAMAQVCQLHGLDKIPDPYITYFKDWTKDPYGGGYHAWKAGVNVRQTMKRMRQPYENEAIHICGEAYSDQQGWVEGALCVAERMLQDNFGLTSPDWLSKDYYLGW